MTAPTTATAGEWQRAFDYFNRALFADRLPACLITLRGGKRCHGYFSPTRFAGIADVIFVPNDDARPASAAAFEGATVDEIAMNPQSLATRPVLESLSTLAHEMTHLEQQHFGEPPRKAYHNKAWAELMKRIGLQPSHNGLPGGHETGQHMTHYVVEGGPFDLAARALVADGFAISWGEAPGNPATAKAGKRAKYTCPTCGLNSWAKHEAHLVCGDCHEEMEAAA